MNLICFNRSKVKGRTWINNVSLDSKSQQDQSLDINDSKDLEADEITEVKSVKTNSLPDGTKKSNKLVKAFSNYQLVNKEKISAELPKGTSGREIRKELGRRWKMLSNEEKTLYCDAEFGKKKEKEKLNQHVYCEYKICSEKVTQVFHDVEDEISKDSFEVDVVMDYNKIYEINFKDEFYNEDDYDY